MFKCGVFFQVFNNAFRISIRQLQIKKTATDCYVVSDAVRLALSNGNPVVALESTIITHGMPHPHNLSTGIAVENIVRENGAVPATVAAINGRIKIGIDRAEMTMLAEASATHKLSRRDLPIVASQGLTGGTTVSATMVAAHHAGVDVFVTGGVGGVHRGAQNTMDISADLIELSRTPVAVVSAGVKSLLDIGRTLEYLETLGVCVATLSDSNEFPAFFTAKSGFRSTHTVGNEKEAALLIDSNKRLGLSSGLLIAVPIPDEFASSGEATEAAIKTAITEAEQKGIQGKLVTPYILGRIAELTQNASLWANIALIKNNAAVGSKIAGHLMDIRANKSSNHTPPPIQRPIRSSRQQEADVKKASRPPVVVGGLIIDHNVKLMSPDVEADGATYPGELRRIYGGVARNMADVLGRLQTNPLLVTPVGEDFSFSEWQSLHPHISNSGIFVLPETRTSACCVVLSHEGQPVYMVGDINIFKLVTPDHILKFEEAISSAPFVCLDGNFPLDAIACLLEMCQHYHVPVLFEPTDRSVAAKIFTENSTPRISLTSPNVQELTEIYSALSKSPVEKIPVDARTDEVIDLCVSMCEVITNHVPVVITTLSHRGVLICHKLNDPVSFLEPAQTSDKMTMLYYPESNELDVVSSVGAGDCFASAFMWAQGQGQSIDASVHTGMLAARLTLQSHQTVAPDITAETLSTGRLEDFDHPRPRLLV